MPLIDQPSTAQNGTHDSVESLPSHAAKSTSVNGKTNGNHGTGNHQQRNSEKQSQEQSNGNHAASKSLTSNGESSPASDIEVADTPSKSPASSQLQSVPTDVTSANRLDNAASQNGCATESESSSSFVHLSSSHLISVEGYNAACSSSSNDLQQNETPDISQAGMQRPNIPTAASSASNHSQNPIMTSSSGVSEGMPEYPQVGHCSPSQSPSSKRFRQPRELELSIPLYYAGKNIFITGATGFIGKVFIEKLLRSCPDVAGIYCLIRPKNKQTIQERLEELVESKLFDGLRRDQPNFFSKLHPLEGDVLLPNLGLSPEDSQTLEECVNVVFHSAATVRFDEPLRKAVEMNVISVRKMLNLSRKFKHLEAFVHVSTAYANCDKSYIEEKVYPPPVEPQKIIDVLSWMDDEMVDLFTPKLIGEKPNTYTYTKQLAEHLLVTEGADLPLAIVRPSIVGAAWREPFPGWIDNFNGPSGMYIAAGKGILRWMKADTNAVADIVPVDIPVNIMVAVGWYTAVAKPKSVHIYHATAGSANPFRWGEMGVVVNKSFKQIPLEKCFRRPKVAMGNNTFVTDYSKVVSHLCPAYVCDMALALIGRKPRMVKLYNKLHNSIDALQFFTCNEWQWESTNLEILRHQLTPDDLRMFYFDIRPLHWPTYIENYCLGAKKYVLNEDLSGLPAARAHIRKLRIIRTIFNSAICVILWRVLIAKSQFARNLWFFIVSLVFKFVRFFRITSTMHK